MYYKHLVGLRRPDSLEQNLQVAEFMTMKWPGTFEEVPEEEEVEMRMTGEWGAYNPETLTEEQIKRLDQKYGSSIRGLSLRIRVDPPIKGKVLIFNTHERLDRRQMQALIDQMPREKIKTLYEESATKL